MLRGQAQAYWVSKKGKRIKQRPLAGVLGKVLTRRSRGMCELCSSREQPLVFELPPFPPDPDPERSLMACARCRGWLEHRSEPDVEARCLESAIWSDETAVQMAAARLLVEMDHGQHPWARDALEFVEAHPSFSEWLDLAN